MLFGRMKAISISPIGSWGQRAYEDDIVRGRFLRPQQFHPQRAGCDQACTGRQLRKLYAHAGRLAGAASDPRRRPADRGRPGVETSAPDAGAGLHAARGDDACSAHAGRDRRDHRQAQGRQQRAGRSARGDAADDARDRRPHDVFVRNGPAWRRVARFRDGVWRAAGAAAFSRPAAAAGMADTAGFRPRPLPQALDRLCRPC